MSVFNCGDSTPIDRTTEYGSGNISQKIHSHGEPSSWTISSAPNTPPAYGLDIIYMDLAQWESYENRFPDGSVVLSNGVLTDSGYLTRFASCDGSYIYNATPGTTSGSSATHSHTITGTTATNNDSWTKGSTGYKDVEVVSNHSHDISATSNSTYAQPVYVITRLYEVLAQTSRAVSGTVVFVDGSTGSNWSILTAWNGANIRSGNSNPTVSGSDTHTQTFSTNTTTFGSNIVRNYSEGDYVVKAPHYHAVSGTLTAASQVPYSKYVTPAVLLTTVYHPIVTGKPQIVGLSAW